MALQHHVNGTAHIFSGTGDAGALEELGVSVDGVTISLNTYYDPVYTDHFGPHVGYDQQYFLQDVIIECDLVWWEKSVLEKWMVGCPGNGLINIGVMGFAGDLVVQNGLFARLLIKSTPDGTGLTSVENCWNFPQTILLDPDEYNLGVVKTVHKLKWKALLDQVASSSDGSVLFNFVCD